VFFFCYESFVTAIPR